MSATRPSPTSARRTSRRSTPTARSASTWPPSSNAPVDHYATSNPISGSIRRHFGAVTRETSLPADRFRTPSRAVDRWWRGRTVRSSRSVRIRSRRGAVSAGGAERLSRQATDGGPSASRGRQPGSARRGGSRPARAASRDDELRVVVAPVRIPPPPHRVIPRVWSRTCQRGPGSACTDRTVKLLLTRAVTRLPSDLVRCAS